MRAYVPVPESKFIVVQCKKCKNTQIIYNKAATVVKCLNCQGLLVEPTGGEAQILGKVLQVLG